MKTMKAVRIHSYGGPEVLSYEEAPRPIPKVGEVLVKVHAAGVNPVDWKIREGQLKDMMHHTFPLVLGWDVSGVIEESGPGGTRFRPGDEVYSRPDLTQDGSYAEYIVIKESEVVLKPANIKHIEAASIPLAGLTAWQALHRAEIAPGKRVLIHAAAGGVGSFAVQFARWKGAHVIGTASQPNHDFVRWLGAHEVIDYHAVRFENEVRDVDIVLDTMGGEIQERSWKVLKRGGLLISIVHPPAPDHAERVGARQAYLFMQPNAAQLAEIGQLVATGRIKIPAETVMKLTDARRAHEMSQSGHLRGKIVLRVI